jgi:hypothetical protein
MKDAIVIGAGSGGAAPVPATARDLYPSAPCGTRSPDWSDGLADEAKRTGSRHRIAGKRERLEASLAGDCATGRCWRGGAASRADGCQGSRARERAPEAVRRPLHRTPPKIESGYLALQAFRWAAPHERPGGCAGASKRNFLFLNARVLPPRDAPLAPAVVLESHGPAELFSAAGYCGP